VSRSRRLYPVPSGETDWKGATKILALLFAFFWFLYAAVRVALWLKGT